MTTMTSNSIDRGNGKCIESDFRNKKTVEFRFEKRRHEIERRVYHFDTVHDRKVRLRQSKIGSFV